MSFGEKLLPFWGKTSTMFSYNMFLSHADLPSIVVHHHDGNVEINAIIPLYPMAIMIYFQFFFTTITLVLLVRFLLGKIMKISSSIATIGSN
jgi:Amt family ammonium transporter